MIRLLPIILSSIYFVSNAGPFNKVPSDKDVSGKRHSLQPDFRNLSRHVREEETADQQNVLSRHKRQMPTYSQQLHHVGLFIAGHKYFGIDGRKTSDRSRQFYKRFPVPFLKKMHSKLDSPCRNSVIQCVLAVHRVIVSPGTSSLYPLLHHTLPPLNWPGYYPFTSWKTMFEFRATASYFLCWYTMKREDILAHFMKGKNCLLFLNRLQESRKSGVTVFDWRTDDINKPFLCAEIMFCPNPCYGRVSEGSITSAKAMLFDKGNPCNRFQDKSCTLSPAHNVNLMGMVRNHLNYTCRCSKGKVGVYNARTGSCHKKKVEVGRQQVVEKKEKRKRKDNNACAHGLSNAVLFFFLATVLTSPLL